MNTLKDQTAHLEETILDLNKSVESLKQQLKYANEQLEWFRRNMFGRRSEKIVRTLHDSQPVLPGLEDYFNNPSQNDKDNKEEQESSGDKKKKKRTKTGKHDLLVPEGLPVERIEIDIPDHEKTCPETGQALVKIGEEITRKLAITRSSYFIKEFVRPKYAFPSGSLNEGIKTASMPESVLPKCQLDESFVASILVKKFGDHLPLYRISEIFSRDGVQITRQYLSQITVKCGQAFKPLYDEMLRLVLASGNIFVDESPIDVLIKGQPKAHQGFMWVIVGGKSSNPGYRVYDFQMNRKHENIFGHLTNYTGTLHSDKYGAYQQLAKRKEINWAPCWAHVRRKFVEAESGCRELRSFVLQKIRYLFLFERVAWARSEEERLRIRKEKEEPIIDELTRVIKDKLENGKLLPKSKFMEALKYYYGLMPYLKNYLKDPYARIDNNVAERAIRPLTIGRKNWLFMGSPAAGESNAIILSLVQTCRALNVNPEEYLEDISRRLMSHPANRLSELLPDNWLKARRLIEDHEKTVTGL
jgi:transposase